MFYLYSIYIKMLIICFVSICFCTYMNNKICKKAYNMLHCLFFV